MPSILTWATGFITLLMCVAVWLMLVFYARRSKLDDAARRRFAASSGGYRFGWWALMFALGGGGVFTASASSVVPTMMILPAVVLPILAGILLLQGSRTLKSVVNAIPLHCLLGVQLYRLLGAIFVALYSLGGLPAEFAIPAGVGDIVVGVAAPIVGYLYYKGYGWSKVAAVVWNVLGILDLALALALGFFTSPSPFQALAFEDPNRLVTVLPLVLVPVFAVPLSVLLHFAALKRTGGFARRAAIESFWAEVKQ